VIERVERLGALQCVRAR